jgi:molybdopterin-binding protein
MKLSARNHLKGKITDGKKGATTAHVWIDVGGQTITASITNEAVDELKLVIDTKPTDAICYPLSLFSEGVWMVRSYWRLGRSCWAGRRRVSFARS